MIARRTLLRRLAFVCLAFALGTSASATTIGGCVDDVTEAYFPNRVPTNCTANDVTFVLVGLGVQDDGCVNSADTVDIRLRAILENTTAQTRYDIGMYIATDGGDARRGTCAREDLAPVGAPGVVTCGVGALDLDGPLSGVDNNVVGVGDGDYLTAETGASNSTPDACGDLNAEGQVGCDENGDGLWDDSVVDFETAITLPCGDPEDDGFVNMSSCATWGNQANGVYDNTGGDTCDSEAELVPETKAKCRCEEGFNSDIPRPEVSCTASCTPSRIQPGETTSCTVTYANTTPASCVPDPSEPERFRCGTAGYVRFKTDMVEEVAEMTDFGDFSNVSATCLAGGCTTSLVDTDGINGDDQIVWTPDSSVGTAAIIGPGDTSTLTFDFTLDAGAPADRTLTFRTTGYWANDSSFAAEVAQTTLTCSGLLTTPVTLASFSTRQRGRSTIAEWTTATELQNAGFNLFEELEDGWRKVNDQLIPSQVIDSTEPRDYRYEFASFGKSSRLYVESVDLDGVKHLYGPFSRDRAHGVKPRPRTVDWPAARRAAQASRAASAAAERRGGRARDRGSRSAGPVDVRWLVDRDGIYRVTYEQLEAAGLDLAGVPAAHLALFNRGDAVAARVEPAPGGRRFGPGAFVEFFGEGLDTLYTDTNVYRLAVDPAAARRVKVDGRRPRGDAPEFYMETVRIERDRAYSFASRTGDPWYDTRMLAYGSPRRWSFAIQVDDYLADGPDSRLTVDVWGSTDWVAAPDHHLIVELNGERLADERFDGLTRRTLTLPVPAELVREGTNTLVLELPGDLGVEYDLISLESYALTYPRRFEARAGGLGFRAGGSALRVAGFAQPEVVAYRLGDAGPERLAGVVIEPDDDRHAAWLPGEKGVARYWITEERALLSPGLEAMRSAADVDLGEAEYLIVSHALFLEHLDPLVALHRSRGMSVKVVDVEDIFSRYSHGIFDPEAIRSYIHDSAGNRSTRLVLLVGADTFDYRDRLGLGSVSFVPTLYAATGAVVTFAPVDPLYADLDGDRIPDLAIGRLPVRTVGELQTLIRKTLEYDAKDYATTGVFAADEFDPYGGVSFTRDSEDFLKQFPAGWKKDRAYIDRLGLDGAKALLLDKIHDGVALASYVGHSGPTSWSFSGLLTTSDAEGLANSGRPTVVVQWGCWNNYHVEPRFQTLGSSLLLSGDRGAAAVLGSATLLETASARALSELLAPRLAEPGVRLGEAVTVAKQGLGRERPELLDVLLGWTILGDPGLSLEP